MSIGLFADQTLEVNDTQAAGETVTPYHILVVDDEESMRDFAVEALHYGGYNTDAVDGGTAAMRALRADHYDLVLTDFNMPNGSGTDLIIKMHAEGFRIPIIMMTGAALTKEILTLTSMLHVAKILQKPFGMDMLLATVKKYLEPVDEAREMPHHEVATGTDPEITRDPRFRHF